MSPQRIYCQPGDAENRLKELKGAVGWDRTSCHRLLANQFRGAAAGGGLKVFLLSPLD